MLFLWGFELLASCDSLRRKISMFLFDFNTSTVIKIVIFIYIHVGPIAIVLHGIVVV